MAFVCEDLARYGEVLIPPSARDYDALRSDIEQRSTVQSRPIQTSRSAILINVSSTPIVCFAHIWWFRGSNGSIVHHRYSPGTHASELLPFGLSDAIRRPNAFLNTILPGSKRLLLADGGMLGDNTDVREPFHEKRWHGGFFSVSGGSPRNIWNRCD